ncbi:KRAB-A domain-containing protein 2-like [Haliotis rubra]|uniref:KRAB-A domain-containing protein 2-like n=1 Tax=Haliotis rubra TaxID=36100 RepID=UPI001EE5586E|nr:KRAB-A domain-containing protein 2-like [Haliotis rubra]
MEEYYKIISDLPEASKTSKKTPHQYYLLKKYEVLQCGDINRLIRRRQHEEETPLYFISIEETYEVVKQGHVATGHGGRDKMRKRKRATTKGTVVKPIISKDSRAQVDLIDMQSITQGQFKWIMAYPDHLTKFCVLRPLSSKRAVEVAYQLLDIFLLLGAPSVLQSDNGSGFTAQVISELKIFGDGTWKTKIPPK